MSQAQTDALDAVLELHYPALYFNAKGERPFCVHCQDLSDSKDFIDYPCETVQAIERHMPSTAD